MTPHALFLRVGRLLPLLACLAAMVGVWGCQSDSWRFGQGDSLAQHAALPERALDQLPPPPGPDADFQHADASVDAGEGVRTQAAEQTSRREVLFDAPPRSQEGESVIRAQFSPDGGRALPALPSDDYAPTNRTAPTTSSAGASNGYSGGGYGTGDASSGGSTLGGSALNGTANGSTLGGGQTAQAAPAYGQNYGGFDDPNGEPYMPGRLTDDPSRGVLDDLGAVGNDPLASEPLRGMTLQPRVQGTTTGRFMLGVGINSDAGLMGSVVIDEQNFDWRRFPRGWEDIRNATAWRGAGHKLRIEAMPGTEVQRYMVNFQNPYLFNSDVSLGTSFHYLTRRYVEWDEERLGGRVALGYHFNHALVGTLAYRGMRVTVFDPIEPTPQDLTDALGESALHGFEAKLIHDTRDNSFLATQGHLFEIGVEQVVGTYKYPRFSAEYRNYFLLKEHPDMTNRHVLGLRAAMAWSGTDTPIYERYFPGGSSTIRGFEFRGASPRDAATGVVVGGEFEMYASAEYLFPITQDDMLRGVVFCDTGTAQPTISDWTNKYRVAPGFGLRIVVPAMGSAPIALDFAFPVCHNPGDRFEMFSFNIGFFR